jgi:hypothetical protein
MDNIFTRRPKPVQGTVTISGRAGRRELQNLPVIRTLVYSPWPVFLARAITLAGFVLTMFAGLFGSVVGSHNFAIIFVWIAWWTALKLVFIPLGGRSWCAICPIPMPGEWITQRGIFSKGAPYKRFGLGWKWPRKLRGTWMQSGAFLAIGLFSAVTLTTPRLTGWVLVGLFILATAMAVLFEGAENPAAGTKRAFCNYLCPIGGFTGLYAQAAPLEVRVRDRKVCAEHGDKTCYQACPWGVYVTALDHNGPCGMCFECVRACPQDNVTLSLRAFGSDYIESRKGPRVDEALLALVMIACALAFSAVFLGPWGALRNAAYAIGTLPWVLYGASFLVFAGLLVPGLFAGLVRLGGEVKGGLKGLASYARPLLPLGLSAWIAFTISFAFAKISYVLPVLSDPFGLGWNLFGTAKVVFAPDVSVFSPVLQTIVLLGGLLWMGQVANQDADTPKRALMVQVFGLIVTIGLLILLVG